MLSRRNRNCRCRAPWNGDGRLQTGAGMAANAEICSATSDIGGLLAASEHTVSPGTRAVLATPGEKAPATATSAALPVDRSRRADFRRRSLRVALPWDDLVVKGGRRGSGHLIITCRDQSPSFHFSGRSQLVHSAHSPDHYLYLPMKWA